MKILKNFNTIKVVICLLFFMLNVNLCAQEVDIDTVYLSSNVDETTVKVKKRNYYRISLNKSYYMGAKVENNFDSSITLKSVEFDIRKINDKYNNALNVYAFDENNDSVLLKSIPLSELKKGKNNIEIDDYIKIDTGSFVFIAFNLKNERQEDNELVLTGSKKSNNQLWTLFPSMNSKLKWARTLDFPPFYYKLLFTK